MSRLWIFRGLLLLYIGYLVLRAWQARTAPYVPVDWGFESSAEALGWVRGLLRRELNLYALAFLLGLFIPPAWGPPLSVTSRRQFWLGWLSWALLGLVTIAVCWTIAWNELPPFGSLLFPFVCFLAGAHLGSAAVRGKRSFALATGQLAAIGLLLAGTAVLAMRLALADAPLELEVDLASIPSKTQLAERIRATRSPDGKSRPLHLTDAELGALLNSALGRGGSPSRAHIHFEPATFTSQASIALPDRLAAGKFLNVQMTGRLVIEQGQLDFDVDQLRVGRLSVPGPMLRILSSALHAALFDDPQIRRIIEAIDGLNMEPGAVTFVFQPGAISRQIVPSLAQLLWERPDVAAETGIYLRRLIAVHDGLPAAADRFGALTQAAFSLALERSADHDPLLENRAAIFALMILLGHPDLEPFVGEVFDADLRARANRILGSVPLRGRDDWTRHFWVSAGLVLLSNEATSDRIGRLKEQLDSKAGGTGFSFADMLANFAGNRLAIAALRDPASIEPCNRGWHVGWTLTRSFRRPRACPRTSPPQT